MHGGTVSIYIPGDSGVVLWQHFSSRDAVYTETLIRHGHERGPFESPWLALEQAEGCIYLYIYFPRPAPLMRLPLANLTTTAEWGRRVKKRIILANTPRAFRSLGRGRPNVHCHFCTSRNVIIGVDFTAQMQQRTTAHITSTARNKQTLQFKALTYDIGNICILIAVNNACVCVMVVSTAL